MIWFLTKSILSGVLIAFASWLAGRRPILAGFVIALPLMSMLSLVFSYLEYRDMPKINQFALSILTALPLSLSFFIPFLLNRWLKMSFPLTFALAVGSVTLAYLAHSLVFKTWLK